MSVLPSLICTHKISDMTLEIHKNAKTWKEQVARPLQARLVDGLNTQEIVGLEVYIFR